MRWLAFAFLLLAPLSACTTPQSAREAKAQQCRLDTSECESRIEKCQSTGDELTCRDEQAYCTPVRKRCPGY